MQFNRNQISEINRDVKTSPLSFQWKLNIIIFVKTVFLARLSFSILIYRSACVLSCIHVPVVTKLINTCKLNSFPLVMSHNLRLRKKGNDVNEIHIKTFKGLYVGSLRDPTVNQQSIVEFSPTVFFFLASSKTDQK